jgi:hypothetical protein
MPSASKTTQTMSGHSRSTKGSRPSQEKSRAPTNLLFSPTFDMQKPIGVTRVTSYSSRTRRMKIEKSPNITPDKKTTYRIKRSPSAESEKFIKIDISIRGGTSYLPSEARRIHTLPLPQEELHRKRTGLFFNYNTPLEKNYEYEHDQCNRAISWPEPSTSKLKGSENKATAIDRKYLAHRNTNNNDAKSGGRRFEAANWDELQLAKLNRQWQTEPDSESASHSNSSEEERRARLCEMRKQCHEAEHIHMNYGIPEHLPSSPLCPRHPKYWRVMDGKGSQYRGCWMHGVGMD